HRTLRPGAGNLRVASRDRRWTQGRRSSEHTPESAALDPGAPRRAVRPDAGAVERRRTDRQAVLQLLWARPQRADVGCAHHTHSTAGPDLFDTRPADRVSRAAEGSSAVGTRSDGEHRGERGTVLA